MSPGSCGCGSLAIRADATEQQNGAPGTVHQALHGIYGMELEGLHPVITMSEIVGGDSMITLR